MNHSRSKSWSVAAAALVLFALPGALVRAEDAPLRQAIDARMQAAWQREKITPAKPAGDAEFLRRVYLDLVGSIPTYEETVAFLDDKKPGKRETLIDKLLADPRYAQNQTDVWDMILFGRRPPGYETDRRAGFQGWLRKQFDKNVPYNVWARELLRAEGNSVDNGALYYAQYSNAPEDAVEAISQTFLGVQLQCARCHDHPHEEWKQVDFYGMAAFLARLQVVSTGKKDGLTKYVIGERNSGDILFTGPAKDQKPGQKGEPVKPKFLLGGPLKEPATPANFKEERFKPNQVPARPKFSRKDAFADWLTGADNPFFARAIANRVRGQYMGRRLVHPVDNLSPSNKSSHPELLDQLTKAMTNNKFDLKWYIRELVNSKTYQLSSAGTGEAMPTRFQHAQRMRPLSAEELVESWRIATGYAAIEKASGKKPADKSRFRPLTGGYVLQFFGSPNTGTGHFQGGLREHLYLNNGPLGTLISAGKGSLAEFVGDSKQQMPARIERLFLSTLNRPPTSKERERFAKFLGEKDASPADAVWTLLSCSEFRFNH